MPQSRAPPGREKTRSHDAPLGQVNRRKDFSRVPKNLEKSNDEHSAVHLSHCAILAIAIAVTVSQATAIGQGQAPDRSLGGVWLVEITPRNCATGEPIPTAVTKALYTFHDDGTMSVSFKNNSLTLECTAAHGLWRRNLGWSEILVQVR